MRKIYFQPLLPKLFIVNFIFCLSAVLFFSATPAHAVVFDMGKEKFGSYLRSSYLPSWQGATDPFAQSSGANLTFNDQFTNLWSYEFGFLINAGKVTWRVGLEVLQPPTLSNVSGKDAASGTVYYTMNSQITVYTPKIGFEFNLKTWKENRLWLCAEGGYSTLTVQNNYNFTAAGNTQFPGVANFREVVGGTQISYAVAMGFETLMSDSTTISLELGYRMMDFASMTETNSVTNFQGNQAGGAKALRNDGVTNRDINLSGSFVALNLRIWVY